MRESYSQLIAQMPQDQLKEKFVSYLVQNKIDEQLTEEANSTRREKIWSVLSDFKHENKAIAETQKKLFDELCRSKSGQYMKEWIGNVADGLSKRDESIKTYTERIKSLETEIASMRDRYGMTGGASSNPQHAG